MKRELLCVLISVGLILSGCGDGGEPKYPVSGKVLLNGQPVAGAIVAFNPKGTGRPASGLTDDTGAFQLTTEAQGDGALADDYAVTIVKYDSRADDLAVYPQEEQASTDPYDITTEYPAGYDEMQESEKRASLAKNLLPPVYSDATRSPLRAQVRAGTNDNVFEFSLNR